MFSIKRILAFNNSKNNFYINSPDILDITDFIDEKLSKKYNSFNMSGKCLYKLYVAVNYFCSLEFSHFNCFVNLKNNNIWYEFNDSSINMIGDALIDKAHAYCLYYMKDNL